MAGSPTGRDASVSVRFEATSILYSLEARPKPAIQWNHHNVKDLDSFLSWDDTVSAYLAILHDQLDFHVESSTIRPLASSINQYYVTMGVWSLIFPSPRYCHDHVNIVKAEVSLDSNGG